MAESNKLSPRTKHISIKYHHLQSFVHKNVIRVCCIGTQEQTAGGFTDPLDEALFIYLRRKLSGW